MTKSIAIQICRNLQKVPFVKYENNKLDGTFFRSKVKSRIKKIWYQWSAACRSQSYLQAPLPALPRFSDTAGNALEKSGDVLEKSGDTLEKSGDALKKSVDILEKSVYILEKSDDALEKSVDTLEKSGDILVKSRDTLEKSGEALEKSINVLEKSVLEKSGDTLRE